MDQLIWKSNFAIGIEEIDQQHKLLLMHLNKGMASITDIDGIFDKLKAYAELHFSGEEKLMRKIGYPGFEGHQQQHRLFVERVEQLENAVIGGEKQAIVLLVSFLRDWFLEHILAEDKNYANYMRAKMDEEDINLLVAYSYE